MPVVRSTFATFGTRSDIVIDVGGVYDVERLLEKQYWATKNGLRIWLKKERSRLLGDRKKDKGSKKGLRQRLEKKKLKRRSGTWSPSVAGQFKGYVSDDDHIKNVEMKAGLFYNTSRLKRGLSKLHTGGTIRSNKRMIIPIYKNIAATGYTGPMFRGSASKGLKSAAYEYFSKNKELKTFIKNDKLYAFHIDSAKAGTSRSKKRYSRTGLLFIGKKHITVRKTFTGTTDLIHMFNKQRMQMIRRGQTVLDKANRKVKR